VRKKTKRLGVLGATALAALVIGPMSVVAYGQETTTTTATTTTPATTSTTARATTSTTSKRVPLAALDSTITVTTTVDNSAGGSATPASFTYHVIDQTTFASVADGNFDPSGITVIAVPAGTYSVEESPFSTYVEDFSLCNPITVDAATPAACTIANTSTGQALITVTTTVDNSAGGSATPDNFIYHVIDTSSDADIIDANFDASGTTSIFVPPGTYRITEDALDPYTEDISGCATLTVDVDTVGSCTIANTFVVVTTTTTTAPTTTTTVPATTTTVPGQTKVHGSGADQNNCTTVLNPALTKPGTTQITVGFSTDAFPQPHLGNPISLTASKLTVKVPAELLQLGVTANIIHDGDAIPSTLTFVLNGAGTKETTHKYIVDTIALIHVINGKAQPLVTTLSLPNTTWTPSNGTDDVTFSEKSLLIVSSIDLTSTLGYVVTATFGCKPAGTTFLALGARGAPKPTTPPTTTSTSTPTTPTTAAGPGGAGGSGASASGANTLPRTGANVLAWVVLALASLEIGLLAIAAANRGRKKMLNR
jgi:hypothetical protein